MVCVTFEASSVPLMQAKRHWRSSSADRKMHSVAAQGTVDCWCDAKHLSLQPTTDVSVEEVSGTGDVGVVRVGSKEAEASVSEAVGVVLSVSGAIGVTLSVSGAVGVMLSVSEPVGVMLSVSAAVGVMLSVSEAVGVMLSVSEAVGVLISVRVVSREVASAEAVTSVRVQSREGASVSETVEMINWVSEVSEVTEVSREVESVPEAVVRSGSDSVGMLTSVLLTSGLLTSVLLTSAEVVWRGVAVVVGDTSFVASFEIVEVTVM